MGWREDSRRNDCKAGEGEGGPGVPADAVRLAAIATVAVFGLVVLWLTAATGWHREKTISLHVASTPWTAAVFGVVDVAAAAILVAHTWTWLRPAAGLSVVTSVLITAVLALLATTGVFPHTRGISARIHKRCAWAAAALVVVTAVVFAVDAWPGAPVWHRIVTVIFAAYAVFLTFWSKTTNLRRWFLYWETGLFFGFYVVLVL